MLNKEKYAAIQVRLETNAPIETPGTWREDVSKLLDALDKADKRIAVWQIQAEERIAEVVAERDRYKAELDTWKEAANGYQSLYGEVSADALVIAAERDHIQSRAEALERAITGNCFMCIHNLERLNFEPCPCMDGHCEHWEFNEAKIAGDKEG